MNNKEEEKEALWKLLFYFDPEAEKRKNQLEAQWNTDTDKHKVVQEPVVESKESSFYPLLNIDDTYIAVMNHMAYTDNIKAVGDSNECDCPEAEISHAPNDNKKTCAFICGSQKRCTRSNVQRFKFWYKQELKTVLLCAQHKTCALRHINTLYSNAEYLSKQKIDYKYSHVGPWNLICITYPIYRYFIQEVPVVDSDTDGEEEETPERKKQRQDHLNRLSKYYPEKYKQAVAALAFQEEQKKTRAEERKRYEVEPVNPKHTEDLKTVDPEKLKLWRNFWRKFEAPDRPTLVVFFYPRENHRPNKTIQIIKDNALLDNYISNIKTIFKVSEVKTGLFKRRSDACGQDEVYKTLLFCNDAMKPDLTERVCSEEDGTYKFRVRDDTFLIDSRQTSNYGMFCNDMDLLLPKDTRLHDREKQLLQEINLKLKYVDRFCYVKQKDNPSISKDAHYMIKHPSATFNGSKEIKTTLTEVLDEFQFEAHIKELRSLYAAAIMNRLRSQYNGTTTELVELSSS